MDKLTNKVLNTIRREKLISGGEQVTVGLSGGADSACLLYVLHSLERLLKIKLRAVHVNHCLRGEEAERDEAFCGELADKLGVGFKAVKADVGGYAREHRLSTEEAGRILRYEILSEAGGLVATAHHADDQAETVLLNILRGGGLKGLSGISFKRDNIIRPLLDIRKEEITAYMEGHGYEYVNDSTNYENDYTRNRIRNVIMPLMKRDVNEGAALHLAELSKTAGEADEFIRGEARKWIEENVEFFEGGLIIPHKKDEELKKIFRMYVIMESIKTAGIGLKDWGKIHFSDIDKALSAPSGFELDLPGGVFLKNHYKKTVIYRNKEKLPEKGNSITGGREDGVSH